MVGTCFDFPHKQISQTLGSVYSLFEDHIEHAIGAVCLKEFHDVLVFQHVTDARLSLQV